MMSDEQWICENCNKPYHVGNKASVSTKSNDYRAETHFFCSQKCATEYHTEHKDKIEDGTTLFYGIMFIILFGIAILFCVGAVMLCIMA